MLRDGGDEVLSAGAGGLDVFRADFEDFFEVHADVGEFALEEDHNLTVSLVPISDAKCVVEVWLTFLLCSPSCSAPALRD